MLENETDIFGIMVGNKTINQDWHESNQEGELAIDVVEKEDKIIVLTDDSRELNYTVKEKTTLPFWSSIDDLMVNNKNKNLILITCAGWWNQALRSYSERLVIRAISEK